jgi:hypothetical protein
MVDVAKKIYRGCVATVRVLIRESQHEAKGYNGGMLVMSRVCCAQSGFNHCNNIDSLFKAVFAGSTMLHNSVRRLRSSSSGH